MGVPAQHLPIHAVDATGRRGDVKMILRKTRGDAIVDDHTLLTDQYGIAGASHGLLQEPVGIEAIHELGSVGTAELDTTQGADVDHANARPHRHDLLGHTAQLVIWLTIECGSPPEPCRHPLRAGCIMPVSDRRSPVWMKPSAGYVSQRLGFHRWSRRGDARLADRARGGLSHQTCSGQG